MNTHYEVLKVSEHATTEQIKQRFQQLILEHHPDKRGSTSDDADYAHRILQAWEVLRDPVKRQHYDLELKTDQLSQPTINAEIDLDEMDYDESSQTYTVECRCSGLYSITENDLEQGVDVVNCDLCSLRIRVLYDVVDE